MGDAVYQAVFLRDRAPYTEPRYGGVCERLDDVKIATEDKKAQREKNFLAEGTNIRKKSTELGAGFQKQGWAR